MSSLVHQRLRANGLEVATPHLPDVNGLPVAGSNGGLLDQCYREQHAIRSHCLRGLRKSWACRRLEHRAGDRIGEGTGAPRPGDLVIAEVVKVGNHTRLTLADHRRARLYPGDQLLGVFGNRYATDAFEGKVDSLDPLHMLTGAGMMGTVMAKHRDTSAPTCLRFLGYLLRADGTRVNLKQEQFPQSRKAPDGQHVVLVVGTGMNSGKTTTATCLIKGLVKNHLRVAACKLTGSVSDRDCMEMLATDAHDVRDFSDYGFPSTYLCEPQELLDLFGTMVADAMDARPNVIVMEIADGIMQRETEMLLRNDEVKRRVRGLVLAAGCASSALHGIRELNQLGHSVTAVSGRITSSPLFLRELAEKSDASIGCSAKAGQELANMVTERLGLQI